MRILSILFFVYFLGVFFVRQALACPQPQWFPLYTEEMVGWAENLNRIAGLCPEGSPAACRIEKLESREWKFDVRNGAHESAQLVGWIVVRVTPGEKWQAAFRPAKSSPEIKFVPDLFDSDWGYGPYFHQTVLRRRGNWWALAKSPFPEGSWLHGKTLGMDDIRSIKPSEIYKLGSENIFVMEVRECSIKVRTEQRADMWCESGDPPPLTPFVSREMKFDELLDSDGHVRLRKKYTRGC